MEYGLPQYAKRSPVSLPLVSQNMKYGKSTTTLRLLIFSPRSIVFLLFVFQDVQYVVKYYYHPSSTTFSTECSITALRLTQFEIRSAVILESVLHNVQYGVQYLYPQYSGIFSSEQKDSENDHEAMKLRATMEYTQPIYNDIIYFSDTRAVSSDPYFSQRVDPKWRRLRLCIMEREMY